MCLGYNVTVVTYTQDWLYGSAGMGVIADAVQADNLPRFSLWQIVGYFLRLGTFGFGGPVALVGFMHHDLVEKRLWITEADYKEGLALAQLAPGPLAAQLGIYLGYVHYRVLGATLAGLAFVLPSFILTDHCIGSSSPWLDHLPTPTSLEARKRFNK